MIKQFDIVLLKDGRTGCVTDVLGDDQLFYVDVGDSPGTYDSITVKPEDIVKVM